MSKLQKKYLRSRFAGCAILALVIFEIYGIATENVIAKTIATFLFNIFITIVAAMTVYEWIAMIVYEWKIRGVLQEDEWSFYKYWRHRIWDGEFETIKVMLKYDDYLPIAATADNYQSGLKILEKIKTVKIPKWVI